MLIFSVTHQSDNHDKWTSFLIKHLKSIFPTCPTWLEVYHPSVVSIWGWVDLCETICWTVFVCVHETNTSARLHAEGSIVLLEVKNSMRWLTAWHCRAHISYAQIWQHKGKVFHYLASWELLLSQDCSLWHQRQCANNTVIKSYLKCFSLIF